MRLMLAAAALLVACGKERISEPVTVRGMVVGALAQPVAGALVAVAGRAAAEADTEGRFVVEGVKPPYTVLVGSPDHTFAAAWLGLRRSDPVLVLDTGPLPGLRTASVSGFVTGLPVEGMDPAWAYLQTPIGVAAPPTVVNPAHGDYSVGAFWTGPEMTDGTVHVLQVSSAPGPGNEHAATGFPLYGRVEGIPLTTGQVTPDVNFALAPLGSWPSRVRASVPAGYQSSVWVFAYFGGWGGNGISLAEFSSPQPWPDFAVPALADVRVHVWATAGLGPAGETSGYQTNSHRTLGGQGSDLTVALDPPPQPLEPAQGATGVGPGSRFSWTSFAPGDVYVLDAWANIVRLQVISATNAVVLPDFAAVGVELPAGQPAIWKVMGIGPAGGVDGMASADHLTFPPGAGDFDLAQFDWQNFTTQ